MKVFFQKCVILATALAAGFLLSGCFEVRTELTVKEDGSGSILSEVIISERFVTAIEAEEVTADSGGGMSMQGGANMPITEEGIREVFQDMAEVQEITVEDLEDGSRKITYRAELEDVAAFLDQDQELTGVDLRLGKVDDQTGVILWGGGIKQEGMNVSLPQMYAMAKGLYVKAMVTMPVPMESETGELSNNGKTVTWITDLRDQQGLSTTRKFMEQKGEGMARATFPLSAVQFDLPEISSTTQGKPAEGMDQVAGSVEGLEARLATVKVVRTHRLEPESVTDGANYFSLEENKLEFQVILLWEDGLRPVNYETPRLEEVMTDTGVSLLPEDEPHSFSREVDEDDEAVLDSVEAKAPPHDAKTLSVVRGHMPVVSAIQASTVTVQKPQEMVGEGKIQHPALEKVGGYLKSIEDNQVIVEAEGEVIDEVVLVKAGGERLTTGRSYWSSNNTYTFTFSFDQPVQPEDTLEIVVRESETRVNVPFELRDVELP